MTTWSHTFTGTNGAAWDTATVWQLSLVGTGAGTIQTNRGRLASRNVIYGAGANAMWKEVTASVNGEFYGEFLTDGTKNEQYCAFGVADPTASPVFQSSGSYPTTGYFVEVDEQAGTAQLRRMVAGTPTVLGSAVTVQSGGLTNSTTYKVRFRRTLVSGNIQIDWKAWTGTEPGSWSQSYTDSSSPWTGAGKPILTTQNGNATTVRYFDWDNLSYDDLAAAYTGSGSFPIAVALVGTGVPAIPGTAALPISLALVGSGVPARSGSAALPIGIALTASGVPSFSGSPALPIGIVVTGSGVMGGATGSANLPIGIALTASGIPAIPGSAALPIGISLGATGVAARSGSGALPIGIAMTGIGIPGYAGSANLPISIGLAGVGSVTRAGSADLPIAVGLTGLGVPHAVGAASFPIHLTVLANPITYKTLEDFNEKWDGYTIFDFNVGPLVGADA